MAPQRGVAVHQMGWSDLNIRGDPALLQKMAMSLAGEFVSNYKHPVHENGPNTRCRWNRMHSSVDLTGEGWEKGISCAMKSTSLTKQPAIRSSTSATVLSSEAKRTRLKHNQHQHVLKDDNYDGADFPAPHGLFPDPKVVYEKKTLPKKNDSVVVIGAKGRETAWERHTSTNEEDYSHNMFHRGKEPPHCSTWQRGSSNVTIER
ncbi:hypothetical protein CYMTET_29570 [Cymbomonas tetramitiformis]|uniref:Uncharacterized protein n=1 Tax=Cymbomonas tetramitiformis TaxID=36881 RepID=A0AAE0FL51_9CHLO|nr:hypothetical protein CYMTET_29570 [Cymbomonas tetramitiformis]